MIMARCEDYPCCGHTDGDGSSFCPDSSGRFSCATCGARLSKNSESSLCKGCLRRQGRRIRQGYYEDRDN